MVRHEVAFLSVGVAVASAALAAVVFWKRRAPKFVKVGEVSKLFLYPVKSCRGIALTEAECTVLGLRNGHMRDRVFLVVTEDGTFVTARQENKMLLIIPSFRGNHFSMDAPGCDTLRLDIDTFLASGPPVLTCRVWGQEVEGYDCGEEAANWIRAFLGKSYKLVHFGPGLIAKFAKKREKYQQLFISSDAAAYADLAPYLLMTDPSLEEVNSRLDKEVDIRNFRPNIVISGCQPYSEDNWKKIKIGNSASFQNVKPCQRCLLTTIDPDTALKSATEQPLKLLKSYRKTKDKFMKQFVGESALLGVNLCVDTEGSVKIGDPVYATS